MVLYISWCASTRVDPQFRIVSNLFISSTNTIDSVIATIPDSEGVIAEVYDIDNTSFSSFKFKILDKETKIQKTVDSLPAEVNITFKIIAK